MTRLRKSFASLTRRWYHLIYAPGGVLDVQKQFFSTTYRLERGIATLLAWDETGAGSDSLYHARRWGFLRLKQTYPPYSAYWYDYRYDHLRKVLRESGMIVDSFYSDQECERIIQYFRTVHALED